MAINVLYEFVYHDKILKNVIVRCAGILDWKARRTLYLIIVYAIGLSITFLSLTRIEKDEILAIIIWTIIATPFENNPIRVKPQQQFTLSFAVHLAVLVIYGYWVTIVVAALVSTITDFYNKKKIIKLLFNVSQFSITLYLAGIIFYSLKNSFGIFALPEDLPAFLGASVVYIVVNLCLVSIIVSLSIKKKFINVLKRDLGMVILYFAALAPMSMLMVLLYKEQPLTMVLIIPPLAMAHASFRDYSSLQVETKKTLEILADIVDRRDRYTAEHSKRVAAYACAIADEMDLGDIDKDTIESAGRVHDLGKIAISDSVLFKKGSLTSEEMDIMKTHPEIAHDILESMRMYKSGAEIVKAHHERYDGMGYARGLKGKKIPLGARILAVADAFDAMTSDRPYRKALTVEEAQRELERNVGRQFDPLVVAAFIKVLEKNNKQPGVG